MGKLNAKKAAEVAPQIIGFAKALSRLKWSRDNRERIYLSPEESEAIIYGINILRAGPDADS